MSPRMRLGRGPFRRIINGILLVSLTGACLHLYVLQQRMGYLEQQFSLLQSSQVDTEEVGNHATIKEAESTQFKYLIRKHSQLVRKSYQGVGGRRTEHGNRRATAAKTTFAQDPAPVATNALQQEKRNETIADVPPELATVAGNTSKRVAQINPHPYSFVMNNPVKCGDEDVFLLIIVTSMAQNSKQRSGIRQTWGNEANIAEVVIKTVFAIGKTGDIGAQVALEEENDIHRDIIQEDFEDTYRNLTIKTIMCLKWASQFCPNAKFVMKADDDTFVNLFPLMNHLHDLQSKNTTRLLMGWTYSWTKPLRDPYFVPKWYVNEDEYPRDMFPKYACGFAYVISNDILMSLYEVSFTVKYLFLEDVYMGICAEKLGIDPTHHNGFRPVYVDVNSCDFGWLLASHWVKDPGAMVNIWNTIKICHFEYN